MKIVATILAVESRRGFAEKLRDEVAEYMPVFMSCEPVTHDLHDAFKRSKELLNFATLQNADWHLYLEDDQALTSEFYKSLSWLLRADVDLFYLSDRNIQIGQMGWLDGFRVNRIRSTVAGSHGLLYRTKHIPALLAVKDMAPVDFWFFRTIDPHKFKVYQILSPVMARHLGEESTLHEYRHMEQLHTHPAKI